MTAPDPDAIQRQMNVLSRSMTMTIRKYLATGSDSVPPPLPARDDPSYETVRLLHLARSLRTMHRHPIWSELRSGSTDGN